MSFPASAQLLQPLIQVSDGIQRSEAYVIRTHAAGSADGDYLYRLGTNATDPITFAPVPLPAGWQRIARGAVALDGPAAPSLTAELTTPGLLLTTGGVIYKYALSTLTKNGETTPAHVLTTSTLGVSTTGIVLLLPAATTSTQNPGLSRRLFRSIADGSALYWLADIAGTAPLYYADGAADDILNQPAPISNSSGLSSGVVVTGALVTGGSGPWTEVAAFPLRNQYAVDYSQSPSGGTITFSSTDTGTTVVVAYTAGSNINKGLMNALITAIQDIANSRALLQGKQNKINGGTGGLGANTSWNVPGFAGGSVQSQIAPFTIRSGSSVRVRYTGAFDANNFAAQLGLRAFSLISGVTSTYQAQYYLTDSDSQVRFAYEYVVTGLAAGTYTVGMQAIANGGSFGFSGLVSGSASAQLVIEELSSAA